MPAHQTSADDAALLLLAEKISKIPSGEAAAKWSAEHVRDLVDLVAKHKGETEDADVCLLRDVKLAFKALGIAKISAREKAVAAIQTFLWPKPPPKSEDKALIAKEFLKLAQLGSVIDAKVLLTAHPSAANARSSSKGYTAMHFAAMSGAIPMLDWLADHDLSVDALSTPSDGSPAVTPLEVAAEYKRHAAVEHLRRLKEGITFLKAAPASDDEGRLRAAARAGNMAAVSILLRRDPSLARRPSAVAANGALLSTCTGGHVDALIELLRCGAAEAVKSGPTPLQAAVAAQQVEPANALHAYERNIELLQVGSWTTLPSNIRDSSTAESKAPVGALVVDAKLSSARNVVVECYDLQLASATGAPAMERSFIRRVTDYK